MCEEADQKANKLGDPVLNCPVYNGTRSIIIDQTRLARGLALWNLNDANRVATVLANASGRGIFTWWWEQGEGEDYVCYFTESCYRPTIQASSCLWLGVEHGTMAEITPPLDTPCLNDRHQATENSLGETTRVLFARILARTGNQRQAVRFARAAAAAINPIKQSHALRLLGCLGKGGV